MIVTFGKFLGNVIAKVPKRNFADMSIYLKTISKSDKEVIFDTSHPSKIAFIGLNRPKSKNALGKVLVQDFQSAVSSLTVSKDMRCVVIGSLVNICFTGFAWLSR